MLTKGFTGPFRARSGPMGTAEVIRMEGDESYAHLTIATFEDLSDLGGPYAMELATKYAQLLNEGHELADHYGSSSTPRGEEPE